MTEIILRNYQKDAVHDMFIKIEKLLRYPDKNFLLQAPTGSGKTIILSSFLKKWISESKHELSFLWLAPRQLHSQSKNKIERQFEDNLITCVDFEGLSDNKIQKNEIYFQNWESLHQLDGNLIIHENETGNYLENIITNTKNDGRKVIVIIDESHFATRAPQTQEVLEIIKPDFTIEVTATPPVGIIYSDNTIIQLETVIEEQMIKKNILINPKLTDRESLTHKDIIAKGLEKRQKLLKLYDNEKSPNKPIVNPLLLIQIPKKGKNLEDLKNKCQKILKDDFNITVENGKLAIYLSNEKINLDDETGLEEGSEIEDVDNEVEVMIFKEAIALGWDCPRAQILLLFREHTKLQFGLQTIGRIMRMPEWKHYDESELNSAYIYTNLPPFDLEKEYIKGYVSEDSSTKVESLYSPIKLKSFHQERQRERTRLSRKFNSIFQTDTEINQRIKMLDTKPKEITRKVIADGIIKNADAEGTVSSGTASIVSSEDELNEVFDYWLYKWCGKFAPYDSHGRIRTALYNSMKNIFNLDYQTDQTKIQQIILADGNLECIHQCMEIARNKFEQEINKQLSEKEIIDNESYEIPETIEHYGNKTKDESLTRSIMKPFFTDNVNELEKAFMKKLDLSHNVKWWFKNKTNESKYFGIVWKDSSKNNRIFYVDWIVQFNDGKIGLYDTKGGIHIRDPETKLKAEALSNYILTENKKRVKNKIMGGIIANTSKDYTGLWKYNKDAQQPFDDNQISSWTTLDYL